ncbi:MAG: ATPase [Spirochaetes bacterium]|uniref:V-type ATP synthase subunit E n=1 Tax=Candidatus Ornithospirochaeta stercoripullorum TaxID=2840899 RepID=A0A9D9DYT6_9SPIO|nr:ATPase [Candidatus Ornithospirochaeta stercoripullorum]
MKGEDNPLIQGILQEARAKADEIGANAEREAESIISEARERAEREAGMERKSYSVRLEQIQAREESARRSIDRLAELRSLDSAYTSVMAEVDKRLKDLLSDPSFSKTLVSWIAEAAIGLDRKEAKVSFSEKTPVTEEMLREAEALVKKETGASLSLSLDSERLSGAGVVVSSLDGKVSYNNQLEVRMRRYSRDIRRIVQEENARQNSR